MLMKAIALIGLLVMPIAHADGTPGVIEGAFGISLGATPDSVSLRERADNNDAGDGRDFIPENPYATLSKYTVFLVSDHGPVYKIQAVGEFDSGKSCRAEFEILSGALAEKYGQPDRDIAAKLAGVSRTSISIGSRKVTASCSGVFGKHKLKLIYVDDSLAEEAGRKTEPAPATTGERDTTGL